MPKLVTPVLQTNPPEPTAAACGSPHRRGAAPSRWCRSPMVRSANAPTRPIAIDQLCLNDKRACRRSASQLTLAMHAPTHCPKCAALRGDGRRAGSERPASNRVGVEKAPTSGGCAAMGPPNPSLARAGIPFVFSGGGLLSCECCGGRAGVQACSLRAGNRARYLVTKCRCTAAFSLGAGISCGGGI